MERRCTCNPSIGDIATRASGAQSPRLGKTLSQKPPNNNRGIGEEHTLVVCSEERGHWELHPHNLCSCLIGNSWPSEQRLPTLGSHSGTASFPVFSWTTIFLIDIFLKGLPAPLSYRYGWPLSIRRNWLSQTDLHTIYILLLKLWGILNRNVIVIGVFISCHMPWNLMTY